MMKVEKESSSDVRERLVFQSKGESLEQVVYQTVAAGMPRKMAKSLSFLLSKRANLEEIMKIPEAERETILRRVAGLEEGPIPENMGEPIPYTRRWNSKGNNGHVIIRYLTKWLNLYGRDPISWVKNGAEISWLSKGMRRHLTEDDPLIEGLRIWVELDSGL